MLQEKWQKEMFAKKERVEKQALEDAVNFISPSVAASAPAQKEKVDDFYSCENLMSNRQAQ